MEKLIVINDFLLTLVLSGFLFIFYFKFYGRYMLNLNLEWDKLIEKPRIFFLSFLALIYIIILYEKYHMKDNYYFNLIFYSASFLSTLVSILMFLCFKDKVLKSLIFIRRKNSLKVHTKNVSLTNEQIQNAYDHFTERKIISCSLESFESLLNLTLLKTEKIKWMYFGQKPNNKKGKSNLNALVEFIVTTFKMSTKESSVNKSIENIISTYFTDNNGIDFKTSSSTIPKWRNGKFKDYLIELRNEIIQVFNGSSI